MNVQAILQSVSYITWYYTQGNTLVSLVRDTAQYLNTHNKQFQWIWESLISTVFCSPKTESKVAKKFKRKSSIPIQIWLSKNDTIQIHHFIGISQDFNPNPSRPTCSSLVIFIYWACQWQASIFLALRSESLSYKCTEFHTVAASKNRDHSSIACSSHIYLCVAVRAHPIRSESLFQHNANWEFATTRAVSAPLHTPQLGGSTLSQGFMIPLPQGPKIQSRCHLAPKESFDPPKWNMKH